MDNSSLVIEGFQLMLTGMGMVFVFLSVLVFLTGFMQKIFNEKPILDTSNTTPTYDDISTVEDDEIAAISIAIHQFRKNKK